MRPDKCLCHRSLGIYKCWVSGFSVFDVARSCMELADIGMYAAIQVDKFGSLNWGEGVSLESE